MARSRPARTPCRVAGLPARSAAVVAVLAVPAALGAVEVTGDPACSGWLAAALVAAGAVLTSSRLLLAVTAAALGGWAAVAAVYVRLHDPLLAWAPAAGALAVAAAVAGALHAAARRQRSRLRAAEQAAHDVLHDGVTGLANRAALLRAGAHVLALAGRTGREASVLVVEVTSTGTRDRAVPAEPALLRATAQVLAGTFRAADVVARVDGRRFAVLLVGPTPGHVTGMVDRLRRRLDEHGIHVRTGSAFLSTAPTGASAPHPVERLLTAAAAAARPPAASGLVPAPRTPEQTQPLDAVAVSRGGS